MSTQFKTRRNRAMFTSADKKNTRLTERPDSHGHNAAALSWIGAGVFILGILIGATTSPVSFWVLAGLAVQLWIVAAIIRPLEAIWTLLNERLPKR